MTRISPQLFFLGAGALLSLTFFVSAISFFHTPSVWIYFGSLSLAVFVLCGHDKHAARTASTRVPEKVLLGFSLLGGSAGMLLGMHLFRHKTRKASFQFFLLLILALQVAVVMAFRARWGTQG